MTVPHFEEVKAVLREVLQEMGGSGRPRDVVPRVTARFPELTAAELERKNVGGQST